MTTVEVFAPAKINLTLHVTGRRADGYHLLDSLVAFADVGDRLTLTEADAPSFILTGPFAGDIPADGDNLVLRAAARVRHDRPVAITLDKRLPPSSGIGGGSADAAAAVRGMRALAGAVQGDESPELLSLGADLPMCLESRPVRVGGIGERLSPVNGLPRLPAVLVNPLRAMPTPPVFAALVSRENAPMPDALPSLQDTAACAAWLAAQRNDLQAAAAAIEPAISDVLAALETCEGGVLSRMSGSGATCFALFVDDTAATAAAQRLSASHPGWWVESTVIGCQRNEAAAVRTEGQSPGSQFDV